MKSIHGWRLQAFLFLFTPLAFLAHEFAHWLAGTLLGYDMQLTLNSVNFVSGEPSVLERIIVSGAGPLLTIVIAVVAWFSLRRDGHPYWYAVLFLSFVQRALAMAVSVANPNDEARIGLALGIGMWTLPTLVVIGLLAMLVQASRLRKVSWKTNVLLYVTSSVAVTLVVFGDRWLTGG